MGRKKLNTVLETAADKESDGGQVKKKTTKQTTTTKKGNITEGHNSYHLCFFELLNVSMKAGFSSSGSKDLCICLPEGHYHCFLVLH